MVPILYFALTFAAVGFILWLIITYIPMPEPLPKVLIVIVVILVIIWLLQFLPMAGGGIAPFPRVH